MTLPLTGSLSDCAIVLRGHLAGLWRFLECFGRTLRVSFQLDGKLGVEKWHFCLHTVLFTARCVLVDDNLPCMLSGKCCELSRRSGFVCFLLGFWDEDCRVDERDGWS